MRLPEICIDRPVLSIVMSLVIVVFGLISLGRLPNGEIPNIESPIVSVLTVLPGAAPEVIETSVTQVLENEIVSISGIRHISSSSREETSVIIVEFELSRDITEAAAEVRDRVSRVRRELPDLAEEPVVTKGANNGEIWINFGGGGLDDISLSTLAETRIKDRLAQLPGAAQVVLVGARRYAIRLWIDQQRLAARGLVIADIEEALARENVDLPSGRIESLQQEFSVRTPGEMATAEEYRSMVIANRDGHSVRLRDVARVELGAENDRTIVRVDGQPGVAIGIFKQAQANTLKLAAAVKKEMEAIRLELPEDVIFDVVWDPSNFISESIGDVKLTVLHAVGLVLLVIFIFLRSLRAALIPAVAILVSITGTFSFLYLLDFSINTLTLMGLALAVGLVVDDAIVVLENVSRWIEQGTPRLEATRRGMKEISFAVVAASISVIAVFLPLAFLTDATGRLFREFGLAVAAAVAISGFVALTLAPSLCARVLRSVDKSSPSTSASNDWFGAMRDGYARALQVALDHPWVVTLLALLWVGLGVWSYLDIDREFVPASDRGFITTISRAPEGSTLEYTDGFHREVEEALAKIPEIASNLAIVAPDWEGRGQVNQGIIFSQLTPMDERERSQQEIVEQLFGDYSQHPGLTLFPVGEATLPIDFLAPDVALVVQGPDIRRVAGYADEIVRRAWEIPGLANVDTDVRLNKPQLIVEVDRGRASDLGVSVRDIASTLQVLLGGTKLSTFKLHGKTYKVIAQLDRPQRSNFRDLFGLYVRSSTGNLVALDSVVTLEETTTAPSLPHYDRLPTATVTGYMTADGVLGSALEQISAIAEEVIPQNGSYRFGFAGLSERFYESENALVFAYALAVLLVYLVLAAQFESFIHPVTILVAVALSFTGALLTLQLTSNTLNLFSQIGLVMLVGLVTKNSILIVEFSNQLRDRGLPAQKAVLEAACTRFRPVLMTALSTIAGIMPIAIGFGAGGEARAPLGIAVAGGMLFSTALTFFVVPVVYLQFQRLQERIMGKIATDTAPAAPEGAPVPMHAKARKY